MLDRVIAVVDLQRGKAVRGVAGRREHYRPVFFNQTDWSDPLALARFYLTQHVRGLYVADLDALTGGAMQADTLARLIELGCPLWIDAGIRGAPEGEFSHAMLQFPHVHWILATESLGLDRQWSQWWLEKLSADRLTVSIDMVYGKLCTPVSVREEELQSQHEIGEYGKNNSPSAVEAITHYYSIGVRSFLVLDLAAVGGGAGPGCLDLCRAIRVKFPEIQLISGGGVRDGSDLKSLFAAGVDYALIATALQNGAIFSPSAAAND